MSYKLTALLTAAALTLGSMAVQAKDLRLGLITPPPHGWTVEAKKLGESLEAATDGKYTINVFPSGQLGNEAQMLQQLQTGALDMAFMTMAEVSNRVPNMGAFFAPYLVEDIDQAAKLLQSDAAYAILDELPGRVGVKGLGYGMAGLRQLNSTFEVDSVDDLRGKKVRITPFAPTRDFHNLLGVAATPMPLPAVYDALANGQVDAIEMDVENMVKQKFTDVAPHVILSRHMMFPMVAVVSPRTWAQMSAEEQQTLQRLTREHLVSLLEDNARLEKEWSQELREREGVTVVDVGPEFFGDAIEQWYDSWSKKAPALKSLQQEAASYR
ncbi:TRAP transporter substrate-binding protein [Alkalilimnicola sp. S0819]|uniref:TRAP transporter substrate-binding protein n=1 Tax=Alkalilimnicola sp. S0819 TaxID=2613922 RepID=UPI001D00419C|nr:TRAP transporter substrate-binding protein [Alkalilimnicola sp. S0819]